MQLRHRSVTPFPSCCSKCLMWMSEVTARPMHSFPKHGSSPTIAGNTRRKGRCLCKRRVWMWQQGRKESKRKYTSSFYQCLFSPTSCSVSRAVDRQRRHLSLSLPRRAKKVWTWAAPAMEVRAPRRPMSSCVPLLQWPIAP
jgi:hypothetical protein